MARPPGRATARRLAGALLWLGLAVVIGAGVALGYLATRSPEIWPAASESQPADTPGTATVKLAWDPSPSERVVGYKVLYGTSPGQYTASMGVGRSTTATLAGLRGGTRYFIVVVALDAQGNHSPPSNEVAVTPK